MDLILKHYCLKQGGRCPVSCPVSFTTGCWVHLLQCQALPHLLMDLNEYPGFSTCRSDIWQNVENKYHTWAPLFTSRRMSLLRFWHRFKRNCWMCQASVKIDTADTDSLPSMERTDWRTHFFFGCKGIRTVLEMKSSASRLDHSKNMSNGWNDFSLERKCVFSSNWWVYTSKDHYAEVSRWIVSTCLLDSKLLHNPSFLNVL